MEETPAFAKGGNDSVGCGHVTPQLPIGGPKAENARPAENQCVAKIVVK
jgi:hypothetical protein